jgi:DUF4097 and DUF4098 domain-containing protein YvlB
MKSILLSLFLFPTCVAYISAMGESEKGEARRAQFENISAVQIEGVFCDIEYTGTDSNVVKVEATITDKDTKLCQNSDNGRLHIWVERNTFFSFGPYGTNRISIKGPRKMRLDVNNASGDISVKAVDSQRLNLRTASGDISIEEVRGEKNLTTASGDIRIKKSEGKLDATSISGDQALEDLRGDAKAHAKSGSISIARIQGDLEVKTVSGEIELSDTRGAIGCNTISGAVRCRNITLTENSRFGSVSGGIVCSLANPENYRFNLTTVSGSLEADSSKGEKRLSTGSGEIEISASSISGSIRFR